MYFLNFILTNAIIKYHNYVAELMHNLALLTSYLRMHSDVNTVVSFSLLFIASSSDCVVNQELCVYPELMLCSCCACVNAHAILVE